MTRSLSVIVLCSVILSGACSKKIKHRLLHISAPAVSVKTGTKGIQKIKIQVTAPYHFNTDFPSSLVITDPGGLRFSKTVWGQKAFKKDGNGAQVDLPFGLPAGKTSTRVRAVLDCSICRANECRVFKGLHLSFEVKSQDGSGK